MIKWICTNKKSKEKVKLIIIMIVQIPYIICQLCSCCFYFPVVALAVADDAVDLISVFRSVFHSCKVLRRGDPLPKSLMRILLLCFTFNGYFGAKSVLFFGYWKRYHLLEYAYQPTSCRGHFQTSLDRPTDNLTF
jgi:hypothetical protein